MGNLIPGQPLVYERNDSAVYARYRDPPYNKIPRWVVGSNTNCEFLGYSDFRHMQEIAKHHEGFKDAWENMLTQYYLLKDIDIDTEKS
jgi:hypothetical protein